MAFLLAPSMHLQTPLSGVTKRLLLPSFSFARRSRRPLRTGLEPQRRTSLQNMTNSPSGFPSLLSLFPRLFNPNALPWFPLPVWFFVLFCFVSALRAWECPCFCKLFIIINYNYCTGHDAWGSYHEAIARGCGPHTHPPEDGCYNEESEIAAYYIRVKLNFSYFNIVII